MTIFLIFQKHLATTMSHSDSIDKLPKSKILAKTINGTNAVFKMINDELYTDFNFIQKCLILVVYK